MIGLLCLRGAGHGGVTYHVSPCVRWHNPASERRRCTHDYWDRCVFYSPTPPPLYKCIRVGILCLSVLIASGYFLTLLQWHVKETRQWVHVHEHAWVRMWVRILSILGHGNWKQDKRLFLSKTGNTNEGSGRSCALKHKKTTQIYCANSLIEAKRADV